MAQYETPKKPNNKSDDRFVAVKLPESPVLMIGKKNLTGLPRVIRDLAAETFNNIQQWNSLHINGASIIKEIMRVKVDNLKHTHSPQLEKYCDSLTQLVDSLDTISFVLSEIYIRTAAITQLNNNTEPLFITWPIKKIEESLEVISSAYSTEVKVKRVVSENIAHSKTKEELLFNATCWASQPYIDSHVQVVLESLLTETGHRSTK